MPGKKKILVIDDDIDIRESLQTILEVNGFETLCAPTAQRGMDAAGTFQPDLILCDLMMEEVDSGLTTANDIHERFPETPILLMSNVGTATSMNVDISSFGFRGVIQKPIVPSVLIETIREELA